MKKINLSPKQQKIVLFDKGAILIKASAGSGKTRVLTERIKRLVNETNRKILAITFTNKAGEEMKERLGNLDQIKNRLFIGTIHSFCQQVLENHGKAIGYINLPHIFENESDRLELLEQAIEKTPTYYNEYVRLDSKKQRDFRYRALDFISEVKRKLLSEDELLKHTESEEQLMLYATYQDILSSQNAIDFDDLILLAYNLFISNPKIAALYRRTYEYICIDEAQDLNYAQYQLLRSITGSEHRNIMMVGDPNQSIFAFNGSSPEFMTKMFVEDYQPIIIELKENYRSSRKVLWSAEQIIPNSCDLVDTVIEGVFEIHRLEDETIEAKWIFKKIQELVSIGEYNDIEGTITYEKIAVLGRNKYVFKHLSNIFNSKGIPYYFKITPGAITFESELIKTFDLALRIKLNPQDSLHWHKILKIIKISNAKNLQDLIHHVKSDSLMDVINTILNLKEDGSNFKLSLNNLLERIERSTYIVDDNEKKMIINDIKELLEHWHEYDKRTDNKSLLQFKNSMALGKTHPLSQKKGVTFSTVHTMKGQEYDVVFVMGMDDETFPDYRAIKRGGTELLQEKNNAYVAFTRSKRFLYVTWPAKRLMPWGDYRQRKISRFLKDFSEQQ